MSKLHIVRAWKDPEYRLSLSKAEHAFLPAHPAGLIELSDEELGLAVGGVLLQAWGTRFNCPGPITRSWQCQPPLMPVP